MTLSLTDTEAVFRLIHIDQLNSTTVEIFFNDWSPAPSEGKDMFEYIQI